MLKLIDSAQMTHAEFYRLNGAMTRKRVESMLDEISSINAPGALVCIDEARCFYPDEGFMDPGLDDLRGVLDELQALQKAARGSTRTKLAEIHEALKGAIVGLEAIQKERVNEGEAGLDELKKAARHLGQVSAQAPGKD